MEISEKKQLQTSEEFLRIIMENIPDPVFITDNEGNFTFVCANVSCILGYSLEEIQRMGNVSAFLGKNLFTAEELEKAGEIRNIETMIPDKQGWKHTFLVTVRSMSAQHGTRLYICRDIGEQKRTEEFRHVCSAEDALRESEEKYAALVNGAMDGIVLLRDTRVIFANPAMAEILRYSSPEELVNTSFLTHIAPESRTLIAERIRKRLNREEIARSAELRAICKDGTIRHVETSGTVIEYQGKPALLGFVRDISEKKEVEKTLRDRERQLRQAEKMEAIGTLAAGIAHDFNNILGSIILNTEFVMHKTQELPESGILHDVLRAANRARDLVKQILTFSRQTVRKKKAVQISPVFRETLKLLRATVPRTIEIRHTVTLSENEMIVIDPTEFHQIMINLCSNAVHAIGDRSGEIEIILAKKIFRQESPEKPPELPPGQYLSLLVRDSGKGIPAGHMERIFDPFFTTKRAGEGTGMGLAVVHGIVKDCRGGISVSSSVEKGSVFEICIPLFETPFSDENIASEDMRSGKGHILLADDDPELAEATRRVLETLGYSVQSVTDCQSAIQIFRAHSGCFDLLISDLTLFMLCEGRFTEEILKIRKDMPVILCTGYNDPLIPEPIRKLRIEKILSKPFAWRDMAEIVSTVMAHN